MTNAAPSIYPTIRYDDAPAAIRFLTTAFGLVAQEVDESSDTTVNHALLRHGSSLVMLSSRRPGPSVFDHGTCCLYLAVHDPDAHHARAVAAGAEIVSELTDMPYGSREYAARDPEGNVWAFGTYRPAAELGADHTHSASPGEPS
jgi:uncharacterized glyoxalase superfamily protein PhnB